MTTPTSFPTPSYDPTLAYYVGGLMSDADPPAHRDTADPTNDPNAPNEPTPTTFAGFRAPEVIIEALRERAALEGISVGELITYAYTRLLQLEDTTPGQNLAELPEDALRAAIRTVQAHYRSGEIAKWVRSWVGDTRGRQLHPPSPDETPDA